MTDVEEVIDLLSSDDDENAEEKVVVLECDDDDGDGDGDEEVVVLEPQNDGKRGRAVVVTELDGCHVGKNKKQKGNNGDNPLSASNNNVIVMDGKDNVVITNGILDVLDEFHLHNIWSCSGRRHFETNGHRRRSTVQHIQQTDKWSCGFRNLQMLLMAVLPHLPANHAIFQMLPRRTSPTIPNLRQIQSYLEQSWKEGVDPEGAKHYRNKIVDTSKKIGALEVSNTFGYLGLDSTVVQFIKCQESRSLLLPFLQGYFGKTLGKQGCPFCCCSLDSQVCAQNLLQTSDEIPIVPECDCPVLPLYLQWEGHSVMVIGVDHYEWGSMLVLDPLEDGSRIQNEMQKSSSPDPLLLKKSLSMVDIQVVLCSTRPLSQHEKALRRANGSVVTAASQAVVRFLQQRC